MRSTGAEAPVVPLPEPVALSAAATTSLGSAFGEPVSFLHDAPARRPIYITAKIEPTTLRRYERFSLTFRGVCTPGL